MEYVIVLLSVLLAVACALGIALAAIREEDGETVPPYEDEEMRREREKEAHYMRNFWSYDGSEQQEWDE